jgi:hypothetical protein
MSTKPYDLVLRGGTVATSSAVFPADVAIDGETIAAVGRNLPPGVKEIDARNVARRAVRHAAPVPRQNRRARRRDENNPRALADIVSRATDLALRAGANPEPRHLTGGARRPGHPTIPVNPQTLSNPHAGRRR